MKTLNNSLFKKNCAIDHIAVSCKTSFEMNLVESENKHFLKINTKSLKNKINYSVLTVSLIDLLNKYICPNEFDYLSIDTEVNEFEILKNLGFDYLQTINYFYRTCPEV